MPPAADACLALLAVSDDETRSFLELHLNALGCAVFSVERVSDIALEVVVRRPDVVLLDLAFHRTSALAALRALRSDDRGVNTPVVALTGVELSRDLRDALDAGADAYLSRPLNGGLLRACVEGLLARPQLARRVVSAPPPRNEGTSPGHPAYGLYDGTDLDAFGRSRRSLVVALPPDTDEITSSEWALFKAVEAALRRCATNHSPLAAVMMQIEVGVALDQSDRAAFLSEIWARITTVLEHPEALRPFEGSIFCAILPETDEPTAVRTVKAIQAALEADAFQLAGQRLRAEALFGIAVLEPPFAFSPFKLIDSARHALQQARHLGGCGWWVQHPEQMWDDA